MNILLHTCCGPCTIYPLSLLREYNFDVTGFFSNFNIHPFREFRRRLDTFEEFSRSTQLPTLIDGEYGLRSFVRKTAFKEDDRCQICYRVRLEKTVFTAKEKGFDCFSTTLLYSRYQSHDHIRALCSELSSLYQIRFVYFDFRDGWQLGIDESKKLGLYRQPYCGCVFSEQERYDKSI